MNKHPRTTKRTFPAIVATIGMTVLMGAAMVALGINAIWQKQSTQVAVNTTHSVAVVAPSAGIGELGN